MKLFQILYLPTISQTYTWYVICHVVASEVPLAVNKNHIYTGKYASQFQINS